MDKIRPDILDSAQSMKSLLGTFWENAFIGQSDLNAFLHARATVARNLEQLTAELVDSRSRTAIQPYSTKKYFLLDFDYSTAEPHEDIFASGRPPAYGLNFPATENLISVPLICSKPFGHVTLVEGIDFRVEDDKTITVLADLASIAPTKTLWGKEVKFDEEAVWLHWGYLVQVKYESGDNYKGLVNAVMGSGINGAALFSLVNAVRHICDVPVFNSQETIEVITTDQRNKLVITDKYVYRCRKDDEIPFSVGDTVFPGQFVSKAVRILCPPLTTVPSDLAEIEIPARMLAKSLGALTFENTDKTITVTQNVSGKTKITWPMPGDATNNTAFFDLMHTRGVATDKTLANYLDTRPQPQSTEPGPANLPTTVNPAQFLLKNVLRNNYYIIVVDESQLGTNNLGLDAMVHLKKILPPESGYLLVTI